MDNQYPVPRAQVAARVVEGQAVIILTDSGEVNVLNDVGTRIWELVDGKHSVQEIAETIVGEFQVSREVALEDTKEFLKNLEASQVIVWRDTPRI